MDASVKRRSRMRREPTGKRIELTERDLEIFRLLSRHRYLRSTFIHAFVGGNKTKFLERLGDLYHEEGFLDRPEQQWQAANARYQPVVYELSRKGADALKANGGPGDIGALPGRGAGPHRQFAHTLLTCEILASFELGVAETQSLRLVWWPQILAKAPTETQTARRPLQIGTLGGIWPKEGREGAVEPDALFGIEYRGEKQRSYRFFALEADRGTMPVERSNGEQSSYLAKLIAYRKIIANGVFKRWWGVPNLFVLTVTTSETRLGTIEAAVSKITEGRGSSVFLFKVFPAPDGGGLLPMPQLLTEPWKRVGFESLDITRP